MTTTEEPSYNSECEDCNEGSELPVCQAGGLVSSKWTLASNFCDALTNKKMLRVEALRQACYQEASDADVQDVQTVYTVSGRIAARAPYCCRTDEH